MILNKLLFIYIYYTIMGDKKLNIQEQQDNGAANISNSNKSSEQLQQEKWNIVNVLQDTELTIEDIQKSITIGDETEEAQDITKSIITMASSKELYNSTFINLRSQRNELRGVYKADNLLNNNPESKIVLYDILWGPERFPFDFEDYNIRDLFVLERCLERPNCVATDVFEIWKVKFWQWCNKEFYEQLRKYTQSKSNYFIGILRHNIRHKCAIDVDELLKNKELIFESYQEYNSYYWPCTFEEFVNIIVYDREFKLWVNTMEWKILQWVYCDMDGTLIISDKDWFVINEKVLGYLKEQEMLWKEIHIWTWWDINKQQQKLNEFWIKYPLISKYKYNWAEAEIVIDDQSYDSFQTDYWIKAKNYVNVCDL